MMKGRWALAFQWGRVWTFYLWTSLKGDWVGLAWKTIAAQGREERAMAAYWLCSAFAAAPNMHACMCAHHCACASFICSHALAAELFITKRPLTLVIRDERHLFLWWGLRGTRYSLSVTPHWLGISFDKCRLTDSIVEWIVCFNWWCQFCKSYEVVRSPECLYFTEAFVHNLLYICQVALMCEHWSAVF